MKICIDFDGTIADHRFPEIGPEVPHAFHFMKLWQKAGAELRLFTMRADSLDRDYLTEAIRFIRTQGLEFHCYNEDPDQDWTNSPKLYGELYIDDAAFGVPLCQPEGFHRKCVDWSVVGPAVLEILQQRG